MRFQYLYGLTLFIVATNSLPNRLLVRYARSLAPPFYQQTWQRSVIAPVTPEMVTSGTWALPVKQIEERILPGHRFNYLIDTKNLPRVSPSCAWVIELDKSDGADGVFFVSEQWDKVRSEREFPLPARVSTIRIQFAQWDDGGTDKYWNYNHVKNEWKAKTRERPVVE